jgi:hypothetical protein
MRDDVSGQSAGCGPCGEPPAAALSPELLARKDAPNVAADADPSTRDYQTIP